MPAPDYAVEIDRLEAALSSGELTVEQDGERVTYRSRSDLEGALSYFRNQAASGVGVGPAPRSQFGFRPAGYSKD